MSALFWPIAALLVAVMLVLGIVEGHAIHLAMIGMAAMLVLVGGVMGVTFGAKTLRRTSNQGRTSKDKTV